MIINIISRRIPVCGIVERSGVSFLTSYTTGGEQAILRAPK